MNQFNRSTRLSSAVDLSAFIRRARTDCGAVQAVAHEGGRGGTTRFELQLEFPSRAEAVSAAAWAFGCDRAAVGRMDARAREFVVTDVFERRRGGSGLVVFHRDLVTGAERLTPMEADLSPGGLSTAFAGWRINARDYLELDAAHRTLVRDDTDDGLRSEALAVVAAARARLQPATIAAMSTFSQPALTMVASPCAMPLHMPAAP